MFVYLTTISSSYSSSEKGNSIIIESCISNQFKTYDGSSSKQATGVALDKSISPKTDS